MGQIKAVGFQPGDIVTRDGSDRQRVISTNQEDPRYAADLIEVECIQAPLGYLEEDGVTRGEPWCKVGEREENVARRYTYADDTVEGADGSVVIDYFQEFNIPQKVWGRSFRIMLLMTSKDRRQRKRGMRLCLRMLRGRGL